MYIQIYCISTLLITKIENFNISTDWNIFQSKRLVLDWKISPISELIRISIENVNRLEWLKQKYIKKADWI